MDDLDAGVKDRQYYTSAAYINAFGTYDEDAWDPDQGFAANRGRIVQLYDYYRITYLKRPELFLWAGLGRMAGGAVVGGRLSAVHEPGDRIDPDHGQGRKIDLPRSRLAA